MTYKKQAYPASNLTGAVVYKLALTTLVVNGSESNVKSEICKIKVELKNEKNDKKEINLLY